MSDKKTEGDVYWGLIYQENDGQWTVYALNRDRKMLADELYDIEQNGCGVFDDTTFLIEKVRLIRTQFGTA